MAPQEPYDVGEVVYSLEPIENDGGIPGIAEDALLATPGRRGVVVMYGHSQVDPSKEVYLVRFEDADGVLGPPVGVLPEELTQDEAVAKQLAAV
ncbi:MAG TPA: nitrogen fixation protein NifZ [Rhodocyclaceae bacterium]